MTVAATTCQLKECHFRAVIESDNAYIVGPLFKLPKVENMMTKSELHRQEIQSVRATILERLRSFIRKSEVEELPVKYFESSDPLAKFLHS